MTQFALCVGINKFENLPMASWLNGCVNDANDVRELLASGFGFADASITVLTDQAATKDAAFGAMTEALDRANAPGEHLDHIVFTMSSHGTQLPDTSGDEADQVDEAFATYDLRQNGAAWDPGSLIVDDELHDLFARLPKGVLVDVILDTCHSGAFTHFLLDALQSGSSRGEVIKQVNAKLRARKFAQRAQLEASALGKSTAWGTAF
ncbi:caspase family protein [Cryobacterium sp. N21]|uniref:caspase family protein n=1 Tax=Cryobacterium sp. N21 TaxID=2048289 RepID=UPI000CE4F664|nr:caspase family protein [Cryobacterium sp. N21]